MSGVLVLHHAENRGVVAALNSGIAVARERGYSWVLTLEDDTLIGHGAALGYGIKPTASNRFA